MCFYLKLILFFLTLIKIGFNFYVQEVENLREESITRERDLSELRKTKAALDLSVSELKTKLDLRTK